MDALAVVVGLVLILVGLAVSIGLHEIGHLVPAKKFGVRVGQYMIGFGPTLWSRRIGETEYGFKLLPLGGYISMAGMYPPSPKQTTRSGRAAGGFFATMVQDARDANDETIDDDRRTFYRLPTWKRIVIMLGGPVMNLLLAAVLFTIVTSGFGVPQASTTLASVSQCVQTASASTGECGDGDPAGPAAQAGLEPGDRIVSIDGQAVATFTDVQSVVFASPGKRLAVDIVRGGESRTIEVTPITATRPVYDDAGRPVTGADGEPQTQQVGFIGVTPQSERVRQPLWAGVEQAVDASARTAQIMAQLPQKIAGVATSLFTGSERDVDGPISVVGVGVIAGEVATSDAPVVDRAAVVLSLLGSLNIALFVFNLIPLLPLDGGHVAVALWDAIRRGWAKIARRPAPKPVDATKLVPITFVVMVLLIGVGALLLIADVVNPVKLFN